MMRFAVIPAQAGTQPKQGRREATAFFVQVWAPVCAGVTGGL